MGLATKAIDQAAFPLVKQLVHRGDEALLDVMKWLMDQQK